MDSLPPSIHYQLLHRTASALIEAERFKTDAAAMIVHSFSPSRKWFPAFAAFCAMFGVEPQPDCLLRARTNTDRPLFFGWASGSLSVARRPVAVPASVPKA